MSTMSLSSFQMDGGTRGTSTCGRDSGLTSKTRFSNFGDGACGEPFTPHHLQLDFTADTEVDTAVVEQKIIDFWDFVNSTPEIQHILVKSEKRISLASPRTEVNKEQKVNKEKVVEWDQTAVSSLELFSKPGRIAETPSMCTSLSLESKENNPDIKSGEPLNRGSSKACQPQKTTTKAKKLCKMLKEWDVKHPKSMEPPGHPPALDHCIIQRQVLRENCFT